MSQINVEENNFKVYLPDSFNYLKEDLENHLKKKIKEITTFMRIDEYEQVRIFLDDNLESFTKMCKGKYPMTTLAGAFGYDNVKVYADNSVSTERIFNCISHELVHLLYQNHVQEKGIQNRVIWFDEGLATNLSGEHDKDNLNEYLEKKIFNKDKIIPNISFLNVHGCNYGQFIDTKTNKYNGYAWSYIMLKYLIDTMDTQELQYLMRHKEKIKKLEKTIINDTYNYYRENSRSKYGTVSIL